MRMVWALAASAALSGCVDPDVADELVRTAAELAMYKERSELQARQIVDLGLANESLVGALESCIERRDPCPCNPD